MRRAVFALAALVLLFPADALAARRRAVRILPPRVDSPYVATAKEAAAWLETMEQRTASGALSWRISTDVTTVGTGYHEGSAGIAMFFLKLYQVTGEPRWLEKAEAGARYSIEQFDAGRSRIFEWLGGVAGEGDALLMLYETTRSPQYLDAANRIADWLEQTAIPAGDGVYWHPQRDPNAYTGVAHGAAGPGLFLLRLHDVTGDARRLELAERAYRWIATRTLLDALGGIGFKRQANDSAAYHGWCGGSGGIALFVERLYDATGKEEYREMWRRTLDGLVNAAEPGRRAGTSKWPMTTALASYGFVYCHGAGGHIALLAEASARTGEARYRQASDAGAAWLDSMKSERERGVTWTQFEGGGIHPTGIFVGTAAVGHGSLRRYRALRDPRDLERATEAAEFLLSIADHPATGQSRWINRLDQPSEQRYNTGVYNGTAGIGLFLLELDEARRGVMVLPGFSPLNP